MSLNDIYLTCPSCKKDHLVKVDLSVLFKTHEDYKDDARGIKKMLPSGVELLGLFAGRKNMRVNALADELEKCSDNVHERRKT